MSLLKQQLYFSLETVSKFTVITILDVSDAFEATEINHSGVYLIVILTNE